VTLSDEIQPGPSLVGETRVTRVVVEAVHNPCVALILSNVAVTSAVFTLMLHTLFVDETSLSQLDDRRLASGSLLPSRAAISD
jgi:hypothetical protein